MALNNNTILTKAWLEGTNDYQQRIPNPVHATLEQSQRALFAPCNGKYLNEFYGFLVNRVGYTRVKSQLWDDPTSVFLSGNLDYGYSVQEIALRWIRGHAYDAKAGERLLKTYEPDGEQAFYSVNRQMMYPISIELPDLEMAVVNEGGLNRLINAIHSVPINSDRLDHYNCIKQQIAIYDKYFGFFRHRLASNPVDEASGKEFLTAVRTYVGKLVYPSVLYSGVDVPTFAKPDELMLFLTPESAASLSVNVLADIFHVEMAEVNVKQFIFDELPVPNAVAILTTKDFFINYKKVYQTTSNFNEATLVRNSYLHDWEVIGASPFVPAIMFTTEPATVVPVIKQEVTGVSITGPATVEIGGEAQLAVKLEGSIAPENPEISVRPDSVTWLMSAMRGEGENATAVCPGIGCFVDRFDRLHVNKRCGLEVGDKLTLTGTATYYNPSGPTGTYQASVELTVVANADDAMEEASLQAMQEGVQNLRMDMRGLKSNQTKLANKLQQVIDGQSATIAQDSQDTQNSE